MSFLFTNFASIPLWLKKSHTTQTGIKSLLKMALHNNKTLYNEVFEGIHNIEVENSHHKEIIFNNKKNLVHINFRILQAQNKHTHEYIPTMVTIRKYLLHKQKIHQEHLDKALNSVSEHRKMILTC